MMSRVPTVTCFFHSSPSRQGSARTVESVHNQFQVTHWPDDSSRKRARKQGLKQIHKFDEFVCLCDLYLEVGRRVSTIL